MTQIAFVYDDFNDNSFDATRWSAASGSSGLQSETGGRLLTPCAASTAPTHVYGSRNFYDLRKGRLAVRLSKSGTTDSSVYTMFGVRDPLGRKYGLFGRSSDASFQNAFNDFGTGTATNTDTTVGVGPSWAANSYLGWSFNESTKVLQLSKSTDGVSWTEIHKFTATTLGTLDCTGVNLFLACTSYGTVTNFTPSWDDVTYFVDHTALRVKTRASGGLVSASPKVMIGGSWKRAVPRVRSGSDWVQPTPP